LPSCLLCVRFAKSAPSGAAAIDSITLPLGMANSLAAYFAVALAAAHQVGSLEVPETADWVAIVADDDECSQGSAPSSSGSCKLELLQRRAAAAAPAGALRTQLTEALVDEVYTYGAPATHVSPFWNAAHADGCFPGLRSYTEDLKGKHDQIKQIDAGAVFNRYPHARIASICLRWKRDSLYTPCGGTSGSDGHPDWPQNGAQVYQAWNLHHENIYEDRLREISVNGAAMGSKDPFISARRFLFIAFRGYEATNQARSNLEKWLPGWTLAAKAVDKHGDDEDPVLVVQENSTLDCAVVFTGTNSFSELFTSTTDYGTGYCGFQGVHVGYRNELWTLTGAPWQKIKPKLQSCNKVTCVGHSLGGAICELFAACANSGHVTDPDYQRLVWTKQKPRMLKAVDWEP